MARLRSARGASTSPPRVQNKTRQALREKTNTTDTRAKVHVYENDGDTAELVKTVRSRRRLPPGSRDSGDMLMAGGLGALERQPNGAINEAPRASVNNCLGDGRSEQENARTHRGPSRISKTPASRMAQSRAKEALMKRVGDLAKRTSTSTDNARAPSMELLRSSERSQGGAPATVSTRHSASKLELYGDSLSLSSPPSDKSNSARNGHSSFKQQGSILRQRNTPAAEASVLVLKHFKRRPRQHSMLHLVQQHANNAALQAPTETLPDDASPYNLPPDSEIDEVEDDFLPDAEGTPVQRLKSKPSKSSDEVSTSRRGERHVQSSSKRKAEGVESPPSRHVAHNSKRRRSTLENAGTGLHDELPSESLTFMSSPRSQASPQHRMISVVQVINSSPLSARFSVPSSPEAQHDNTNPKITIPSTEEQQGSVELGVQSKDVHRGLNDAHEPPNGTMAEPASSSPPPEGHAMPLSKEVESVDCNAKPANKLGQRAKARSKAKPLSSAALQSLLPKRRQRTKPRVRRSEYDIAGSEDRSSQNDGELATDEDELNLRPRRRQTTSHSTKNRPSTTARGKPRPSKVAPVTKRKTPAAPSRKPAATSRSAIKTYGRTSDRENDDQDFTDDEQEDVSSALPEISMYEATKSKELEDMKRKFAEIDSLDMDFETVDLEDRRSSSSQWR
nr:hypothetical protein CFP56_41430 [Quercus suber]